MKNLSIFNNDEFCRKEFKKLREKAGITCKKCLKQEHFWIKSKWQWQCKNCDFRTTLRSGTVLQHSKLPFTIVYQVMYAMHISKKGISAKEIQRFTGHKRYEPIWSLLHKFRKHMCELEFSKPIQVDQRVKLFDVKITKMPDEIAIRKRAVKCLLTKSQSIKGKTKIKLLQIETHELGDEKPRLTYKTSSSWLESQISFLHQPMRNLKNPYELYNLKKVLTGIHHHIGLKYIQNYLGEFCFKFNSKLPGKELFSKYLGQVARMSWYATG